MEKATRHLKVLVLFGLALGAPSLGCGGGGGKAASGSGGSGFAGASGLGGGGGTTVDAGVKDGEDPDAPVAITPVRLTLTPQSLAMMEGGDPMKFMVGLSMPWSTDITVTFVSANPNVATTIPESFTFKAGTMAPQPVQVLAPIDDDTVGNTTSINVFAPETGQQTVAVSVTDPDVQALLVSPAKVMVTEGRTENLLVRLAKKPASAVVVTLTSSDPTKLTLGAASLTFTPGNYSAQQSVPLMALLDPDAEAEDVTVTLTATGNLQNVTVPVQIIDIDAVNLDVSPSSLNLTERADMPGTIDVVLTKRPGSDVTVTVESSKTDKVTVSPATLTFTSANYMMPQKVTVAAVSDNDARDEAATVTLKASGITPPPMNRTVAVSVKDVDSQSLIVMPLTASVYEGSQKTFTVQMALQPDGDTTVNVFSQNELKLRVNPPVLHFNQTNFTMPQTVTVEGSQDDDLSDETINVTLLGANVAKAATVTITVMDDDVQAIQMVPPSALITQESRPTGAASTTSIGVRLAFRPTDPVFITLVSADPARLSPATAMVVLDQLTYANPQFVTFSAKHDTDTADNMVLVTASAMGLPDAKLPVTIVDTDVQNFDIPITSISLMESSLPPTPGGTTMPLQIKLTSLPASDVTVNIASTLPTSRLTVPTSCTIPKAGAITTGCTVNVAAVPDSDGRDESGIITISAIVDGVALTQRTVAVGIKDNDIQGLVLSSTDLGIINEGETSTFKVALALNPIVDVTVGISSNDPHFTVSPSTLTFNSTNYGMNNGALGQTITVTAVDDQDMDSYTGKTITVGGGGAGAGNATVKVSEMNNDVQKIITTFPGTTLSIMEGSSYQVGVRLTYKPVATETVTVTSADPTRLSAAGGPSKGLTFASDYSAFQYVTLTSLSDLTMGDHTIKVTTVSNQAATLTVPDVMVTIPDIDTLNFIISPDATSPIPEGGTVNFHVQLTIKPTSAITVSLGSLPSTCSPTTPVAAAFSGSATCMLSDSKTAGSDCLLTVQACEDANALPENVAFSVSGTGGISPRTLMVSTIDNDSQALVVTGPATQTGTTIREGDPTAMPAIASGTTTFLVKLNAQPAAATDVSITISPSPDDGIKVYRTLAGAGTAALTTTLSFTTANYGTAQEVTVVGVPDPDLRTDPFSIRISAPSLSVTDAFVSVTETDDNTQHIRLFKASGSVCGAEIVETGSQNLGLLVENAGTLQFCASLSNQPLSNTVLDLVVATDSSIVSIDKVAIPFTTSNYAVQNLVTLTGTMDDNAVSGNGTISLTSSGFAATRSLTFTTMDGETQALEFQGLIANPVAGMPGSINVVPGNGFGSGNVGVKPAADPITSVDVTCGSNNPLVTIPSGGMYSFNGGGGGSWKSTKNIHVSAAAVDANNSSQYTTDATISCQIVGTAITNTFIVHVAPPPIQ